MVRVPQLLVDAALSGLARLCVRRRLAAAGDCDAVVPARVAVGVRHSGHHWASHVQWIHITRTGGVRAALTAGHHGCVLVLNGSLRGHHLLVLQEILLSLVATVQVL